MPTPEEVEEIIRILRESLKGVPQEMQSNGSTVCIHPTTGLMQILAWGDSALQLRRLLGLPPQSRAKAGLN